MHGGRKAAIFRAGGRGATGAKDSRKLNVKTLDLVLGKD